MRVRRAALFSGGLTITLTLAVCWLDSRPVADNAQIGGPLAATPSPGIAPAHPSPSISERAPRRWPDIASPNLFTYAENLRTLSCPEPIVQRIIVEEIDLIIRKRWAARAPQTNFWQTGSEALSTRRARREFKRDLEMERRATIHNVLGVPWHQIAFRAWDTDEISWDVELLGHLPPNRAAQVHQAIVKYADIAHDVEQYADRMVTPEERSERETWERQLTTDLARLTSPAELEEIKLRQMTFHVLDVWSVPSQFGNELSPAEFRELLKIKNCEQVALLFDHDDRPQPDDAPPEQEARIRTFLGEERYQGYLRAQDSDFRQMHRSLDALDQPIETIWKVYDIRRSAVTEAGRALQELEFADAPSRDAVLAALRQETETAVRQALGAEAGQKYLNGDGDWVKRLLNSKR